VACAKSAPTTGRCQQSRLAKNIQLHFEITKQVQIPTGFKAKESLKNVSENIFQS